MIKFLGYSSQLAGKYNLLTVISYTISTVIFGYLSDKINKSTIILTGAIGLFAFAYPFINSLHVGNSPLVILVFSLLMGMFIGMTEGTLNPLTAESFPTNIRASSVTFCWNFSSVAFGSVAPIISMKLIDMSGNIFSVAYYLMVVCAITISTLLFCKIKSQRSI